MAKLDQTAEPVFPNVAEVNMKEVVKIESIVEGKGGLSEMDNGELARAINDGYNTMNYMERDFFLRSIALKTNNTQFGFYNTVNLSRDFGEQTQKDVDLIVSRYRETFG